MTAHILVPALDEERPATLSPRIVTGMLKKQLGFSGVVVTDDIEMGAISAHVRHRGGDAARASRPGATPC